MHFCGGETYEVLIAFTFIFNANANKHLFMMIMITRTYYFITYTFSKCYTYLRTWLVAGCSEDVYVIK